MCQDIKQFYHNFKRYHYHVRELSVSLLWNIHILRSCILARRTSLRFASKLRPRQATQFLDVCLRFLGDVHMFLRLAWVITYSSSPQHNRPGGGARTHSALTTTTTGKEDHILACKVIKCKRAVCRSWFAPIPHSCRNQWHFKNRHMSKWTGGRTEKDGKTLWCERKGVKFIRVHEILFIDTYFFILARSLAYVSCD